MNSNDKKYEKEENFILKEEDEEEDEKHVSQLFSHSNFAQDFLLKVGFKIPISSARSA